MTSGGCIKCGYPNRRNVVGILYPTPDPRDAELSRLSAEVARLKEALAREACRCRRADCVIHGSYVPEDVEFAERTIKDFNAPLVERHEKHMEAIRRELPHAT